MKADDMVRRVAQVESNILQKIGALVEEELMELAEETHLNVHGIDIEVVKTQGLNEVYSRPHVAGVRISLDLPQWR